MFSETHFWENLSERPAFVWKQNNGLEVFSRSLVCGACRSRSVLLIKFFKKIRPLHFAGKEPRSFGGSSLTGEVCAVYHTVYHNCQVRCNRGRPQRSCKYIFANRKLALCGAVNRRLAVHLCRCSAVFFYLFKQTSFKLHW